MTNTPDLRALVERLEPWIGQGGKAHILMAQLACCSTFEYDYDEGEQPREGVELPSEMASEVNDALGLLRDDVTTLQHRVAEMEAALEPFAKVADAFDYWLPEVMPDFSYPVLGTSLENARADCPTAVGGLNESHFRKARSTLKDRGEGR